MPLVITSHRSREGSECNSSNTHALKLIPCFVYASELITLYVVPVTLSLIIFVETFSFVRFLSAGIWSIISTATSNTRLACSLSEAQPYTSPFFSPSANKWNNASAAQISLFPFFFGSSK